MKNKFLMIAFLGGVIVPLTVGCANKSRNLTKDEAKQFVDEHFLGLIYTCNEQIDYKVDQATGDFEEYQSFSTLVETTQYVFSSENVDLCFDYCDNCSFVLNGNELTASYEIPCRKMYESLLEDEFDPTNTYEGSIRFSHSFDEKGHLTKESIISNFKVTVGEEISLLNDKRETLYSNYTDIPIEEVLDTPSELKRTDPLNTTNVAYDLKSWMSHINPNTPFTQINTPGTHDSMTGNIPSARGLGFPKCQDKMISEQLNMGVRFFDLRFVYSKGKSGGERDKLTGAHGGHGHTLFHCYTKNGTHKEKDRYSFQDVINECKAFLDAHDSEFIILKMDEEDGWDGFSAEQIRQKLLTECQNLTNEKNGRCIMMEGNGRVPTLAEVKGKIILCPHGKYDFTSGKDVANSDYERGPDYKEKEIMNAINGSLKMIQISDVNFGGDKGSCNPRLIHTSCYDKRFFKWKNPKSTSNKINPWFKNVGLTTGRFYGIFLFNYPNEDLAKHVINSNNLI